MSFHISGELPFEHEDLSSSCGTPAVAMSDWGDSPADSDESIEIREDAEPGIRYMAGCYAHVRLGDFLGDRYQIVHKLGWGSFFTVWMAYDEQMGSDVALKIMTGCNVAENDYDIQTWMKENMDNLAGLVLYERTFFLEGDMGQQHRVLVLPLVGPNLECTVEERPLIARRSAARQLLEYLVRLHTAGIVVIGELSLIKRIIAYRGYI